MDLRLEGGISNPRQERRPAPLPAGAQGSTSGAFLPRGGRARGSGEGSPGTSLHTPSIPLRSPPRDEEPHGHRRLRTNPRQERSISAPGAPTAPAAPGCHKAREAGHTRERRARATLRAGQRSAEGEQPRRCPAVRAPQGAAPGRAGPLPRRTPAPQQGAPPPRQTARPAYRS